MCEWSLAWSKSRKARSSEPSRGAAGRPTSAGRPWEAARRRPGILCQEDGDPRYEKSSRQLVDDGLEQGLEIGFGTEAAAELDEGFAVVVAMTIEGSIDPALNAALEGIEDGHGDEHGNTRAHSRTARGAVMCNQRDQGDGAEIAAEDKRRGERVRHAALEDQVRIHEAVTDDGPTEGEGQKDQRQAGKVGEQARRIEVEAGKGRRKTA